MNFLITFYLSLGSFSFNKMILNIFLNLWDSFTHVYLIQIIDQHLKKRLTAVRLFKFDVYMTMKIAQRARAYALQV